MGTWPCSQSSCTVCLESSGADSIWWLLGLAVVVWQCVLVLGCSSQPAGSDSTSQRPGDCGQVCNLLTRKVSGCIYSHQGAQRPSGRLGAGEGSPW
jgi:hypothetical protein